MRVGARVTMCQPLGWTLARADAEYDHAFRVFALVADVGEVALNVFFGRRFRQLRHRNSPIRRTGMAVAGSATVQCSTSRIISTTASSFSSPTASRTSTCAARDGIEVKQPAGGLCHALDPTMRRTHGTWVAWGSGTADHEVADETGRVAVPPGEDCVHAAPRLARRRRRQRLLPRLRESRAVAALPHAHPALRVSHRILGALSHGEPALRARRRRRSGAVHRPRDGVDSGLPLRARRRVSARDAAVAVHPSVLAHPVSAGRTSFGCFPPERTRPCCAACSATISSNSRSTATPMNFLDCVDKFIPEARVDHVHQTVTFRDRVVHVGAFPISIDVERFERMARSPDSAARVDDAARPLRQGHAPARRVRRSHRLHEGNSRAHSRARDAVDRVARAARAVHLHLRLHAVAHRSAGVQLARARRDAVGDRDQRRSSATPTGRRSC